MADTVSEPSAPSQPAAPNGWIARTLLRAARVATLATAADGQPYAALATPASLPDGSPLLLLSELSEHTRHLRRDPNCALLVAGTATEANPQTAPRVTLLCAATCCDEADLKQRYLAVHPYAALYAGFADFAIWRLAVLRGHFVGGFARAAWLPREELLPDPAAAAAVAAAEPGIISHCNNDHADALAAIAMNAGGAAGTWRMVAADTDGCDLADAQQSLRITWQAPVQDAAGIRAELVRLARR